MGIYYNNHKLISYNGLFNFIIGERGVGKTFGFKEFCTDQFLKDGSQFIYIRRYKTELEKSMMKGKVPCFYEALKNLDKYKNIELNNTGNNILINKKLAGVAISLTTALILKSVEFTKVKYIIFDEFMILKGSTYRYLPNEVTQFLELYETVSRLKDVKVFFLGNAISTTNPYFNYFNIHLPYNSNFATYKNGLIVVEYIKNIAYRETKKKSRFGKLIDGTEYAEYAIDNIMYEDTKAFLKKKSNNVRYLFTIHLKEKFYGCWIDDENNEIFISKDYNPTSKNIYAMTKDDLIPNSILLYKWHFYYRSLISYFNSSRLFFDNTKTKNNFIDFLT